MNVSASNLISVVVIVLLVIFGFGFGSSNAPQDEGKTQKPSARLKETTSDRADSQSADDGQGIAIYVP